MANDFLSFMLGDRQGGGVVGGIKKGIARETAARATREAREEGILGQLRVQAPRLASQKAISEAQLASLEKRSKEQVGATRFAALKGASSRIAAAQITAGATDLKRKAQEANNYTKIGPYFKIYNKQQTAMERLKFFMTSLQSDIPNFKAAIKDPNTKGILRNLMMRNYSSQIQLLKDDNKLAAGQAEYYNPAIAGGYLYGENKLFSEEIKKLVEQFFMKRTSPNEINRRLMQGRVISETATADQKKILTEAVKVWAPNQVTVPGKNIEEIVRNMLGDADGSDGFFGVGLTLKANEKTYAIGGHPVFARIFNDTADDLDYKEAAKYLNDKTNKWIDEHTGMLSPDFYKAAFHFSPKTGLTKKEWYTGTGKSPPYDYVDFSKQRHKNFLKNAAEAMTVLPQARRASLNLLNLKQQVSELRAGSRIGGKIFQNVQSSSIVVKEFLKQWTNGSFDRDYKEGVFKGKIEYDKNDPNRLKYIKGDTLGDQIRNAYHIISKDPAFDNKGVQSKADAAARIEALEVILAYQITGVLQGGTGGRTISDQDVKYARSLFSTNFATFKQRMDRLDIIQNLLNSHIERGEFYEFLSGIQSRINVSQLPTIRNVERLMNVKNRYLAMSGSRPKGGGSDALLKIQQLEIERRRADSVTKNLVYFEPIKDLEGEETSAAEILINQVETSQPSQKYKWYPESPEGFKDLKTKFLDWHRRNYVASSSDSGVRPRLRKLRVLENALTGEAVVVDRDDWKDIILKVDDYRKGSYKPHFEKELDKEIKKAFPMGFSLSRKEPVTITWNRQGQFEQGIVVDPWVGPPADAVSSERIPVQHSDTFVRSLLTPENFEAVDKPQYHNTPKATEISLAEYANNIFTGKIKPTHIFTNFYSPSAQEALGRKNPDWAEGVDTTPIGENANVFLIAIDKHTRKPITTKEEILKLMKNFKPMNLNKQTLVHMAKIAYGEDSNNLAAQKATIDVMYIRAILAKHDPEGFSTFIKKEPAPNIKNNSSFIHKLFQVKENALT